MRVLITNDDGVHAEGLLALRNALAAQAEVTVVAPDRPRSACGHSITLHKPLRLTQTTLRDGGEAWCTNGTPADCVTLALLEVMADSPPDLVFSGINQGPNLGFDLFYSGTFSGALEAAMTGLPAVAISLAWRFRRLAEEEGVPLPPIDYSVAARYGAAVAAHLEMHPLPENTLLNINVPHHEPQGVRVTHQGIRRYPAQLDRRYDPMGRPYYWIGGEDPVDVHEEGADVAAIADGFISVTPVQLNLTDASLKRHYLSQGFPGLSHA